MGVNPSFFLSVSTNVAASRRPSPGSVGPPRAGRSVRFFFAAAEAFSPFSSLAAARARSCATRGGGAGSASYLRVRAAGVSAPERSVESDGVEKPRAADASPAAVDFGKGFGGRYRWGPATNRSGARGRLFSSARAFANPREISSNTSYSDLRFPRVARVSSPRRWPSLAGSRPSTAPDAFSAASAPDPVPALPPRAAAAALVDLARVALGFAASDSSQSASFAPASATPTRSSQGMSTGKLTRPAEPSGVPGP